MLYAQQPIYYQRDCLNNCTVTSVHVYTLCAYIIGEKLAKSDFYIVKIVVGTNYKEKKIRHLFTMFCVLPTPTSDKHWLLYNGRLYHVQASAERSPQVCREECQVSSLKPNSTELG